jgi:hypothetical protein
MSQTRTLYLAWQDQVKTRRWFPVGRLDVEKETHNYRFRYIQGALDAQKDAGFEPLISFPELRRDYTSDDLFPLFLNRLMNPDRQEFNDLVEQLALTPEKADPIEILSITGGFRETDNLEVFPKIDKRPDGGITCRFFLHGYRHINAPSQERLKIVKAGDQLRLAIELNNPATKIAVQLQSGEDYHMLGWAPRYLIKDLILALMEQPFDVTAKVIKVNPEPAPAKQRVLIELDGQLPESHKPMSTAEFVPLVN